MYPPLHGMEDARFARAGHNGWVAGRIARLVAFFRRAEPLESAPSGWALTFDVAVAVGAAVGAVYEMAMRSIGRPDSATITVSGPAAVVQHAVQYGLPLARVGRPIYASPLHPSVLLLAAAALTALPLAWRRVYPITAWLVVIAAIVVVRSYYVPPVAIGTAVFAAYSAIAHSRYRNLAIAMVSVTTIAVTVALGRLLPRIPGPVTAIIAIATAGAAGLGIRVLRRRLADSTARLRRAAADAEAATQRALTAERARIASELHDVVTHNVSVMIVQAGAARKIMATFPGDAEDALLAVEATGREAMTELRNLLGLLSPAADGRDGGPGDRAEATGAGAGSAVPADTAAAGPAPVAAGQARAAAAPGARAGGGSAALRPQPGLGELDALVGRVSAAGLPVELRVSGQPRPLSPGADLAAYRVVQEGLTNVLRHAGRAAATVGVEWGEELVITVNDDGDGSGGDGTAGRGLIGLRERLALYGGELAAGPRPDGGWQVRAAMPAGTTPAATMPAGTAS
jgi:signal transduction histidine kinase